MIPQNSLSPCSPALHKDRTKISYWGQLPAPLLALAASALQAKSNHPLVLLTCSQSSAYQLLDNLKAVSPQTTPHFLPDWEVLPYDTFSPHEDIVSQRLSTLYTLSNMSTGIVIVPINSLIVRLPPKEHLLTHTLVLKTGAAFSLKTCQENLIAAGYRRVDEVHTHGEFALRGGILDIFPMGSSRAIRIETFDDTIETLRYFDLDTQRSIEKCDSISIMPAHEFPLTKEGIEQFRQAWRETFDGNPSNAPLYQSTSESQAAPGIEFYLPLFYKQLSTFFDYLPDDAIILQEAGLEKAHLALWDDIETRYEQCRHDVTRPLLPPRSIYLPSNTLFELCHGFQTIQLNDKKALQSGFNYGSSTGPNLPVQSQSKHPLKALAQYIDAQIESGQRVLLCAESQGRRELLNTLLKEASLTAVMTPSLTAFINTTITVGLTVAPFIRGFENTPLGITVITETQLFGEQVQQKRLRKQRELDPNVMIRSLIELKPGDPVVHITHGIGRYQGLIHIDTNGINAEYVQLEYAGNDKIYVPVADLHCLSRYVGCDKDHAPINKLGSGQWDKKKEAALKKIADVAAELLSIHSERAAATGFACAPPREEFNRFRASFPFEETPEQKQAIDTVIADMCQAHCMDRLICGDVGFGKTEVAVQAAFLAVTSGKQVAVLVPTTLLAQQHTETFQNRLANWPIKVAGFSRFNKTSETTAIKSALSVGTIDIVIGTHKLLSKDIHFKDLGLLIIDEEQRFGVQQKEKIKALRAKVDILTLTATPIPRTLNMTLSGMRDLSLITTPPAKRLSIKTFVRESSDALIKEACLRETMRGGQVYFLHNDIATLAATKQHLQTLLPDARIVVGHGQIPKRQLASVMSDFYHQKANILLCTTIIESGIDIPNANTIIIDRADKFGLAQLHQIRGRVGRSHHQAYAYLLTPPWQSMTKDATLRLEAIANLGNLGAGFQLATQDLEIRGAGEMLGAEQSGSMEAIGFSLYMELLDEAVQALKSGQQANPSLERTGIDISLPMSTLLPEDYVRDVGLRLNLYKRLADCKTPLDVDHFSAELIDRFGPLPEATLALLNSTKLKQQATLLGIKKLTVNKQIAICVFNTKPNIDVAKMIQCVQRAPDKYQLKGEIFKVTMIGDIFERLSEALKEIALQ